MARHVKFHEAFTKLDLQEKHDFLKLIKSHEAEDEAIKNIINVEGEKAEAEGDNEFIKMLEDVEDTDIKAEGHQMKEDEKEEKKLESLEAETKPAESEAETKTAETSHSLFDGEGKIHEGMKPHLDKYIEEHIGAYVSKNKKPVGQHSLAGKEGKHENKKLGFKMKG